MWTVLYISLAFLVGMLAGAGLVITSMALSAATDVYEGIE